MAATTPLALLTAELPVVWTTRGLETWLAGLPASERAELAWTRPQLQAALHRLLEEPLDAARVDAATRDVLKVSLSCRRLLGRLLQGELPLVSLLEPMRARVAEIAAFLEIPASAAQAELTLEAFIAVFRAFDEQRRSLAPEDHERLYRQLADKDVDVLLDEQITAPSGSDIARANALFAAQLEAFERRHSPARGRELARLALRHIVRAVVRIRLDTGLKLDIRWPPPAEELEDQLLHAAGLLALAGRTSLPGELAGEPSAALFAQLFMSDAATPSPPTSPPLPRLRRITARVTGVAWSPPQLGLEGEPFWFSTTPEMVERALSLRGEPTQAVVLDPHRRLLRIDPAEGPAVGDADARTQAMIQDWDELLHRLAR